MCLIIKSSFLTLEGEGEPCASHRRCPHCETARIIRSSMKSFEILDKRAPSPSRGGPGKGHLGSKVHQILSTGMVPLNQFILC